VETVDQFGMQSHVRGIVAKALAERPLTAKARVHSNHLQQWPRVVLSKEEYETGDNRPAGPYANYRVFFFLESVSGNAEGGFDHTYYAHE
jgi:hypothetical protein